MVSLESVRHSLRPSDTLAPHALELHRSLPSFDDDRYWGPPSVRNAPLGRLLMLSGPSRDGNHRLQSMLDDHPQVPRVPREDSFLAAVSEDLRQSPDPPRRRLTASVGFDYILTPSSRTPSF